MTFTVTPLPASLAARADVVRVDTEGGAPLRCCLRDSRVGERIALVLVTPPGPAGAYAESGPVYLHADGCAGPSGTGYPEEFRARAQVFRAYGHDGTILGGELVGPEEDQDSVAERLLDDDRVAFVQTRNVLFGCYMLTLSRGPLV